MVENHHNGSGTQNNYNANSQNVNHGQDQIVNFVENFITSNPNSYKNLWSAIAGVGASHTAEQQYERGECLEETRVELRRMIHEWGKAKGKDKPLCWLTGAAGVGKTAVAMSAAKACQQEGRLVSSFFFFRSDPKRNNPRALWLTVAHGLASTIPFMRRLIERRISKNPKILEAIMEDQFRELILGPFPRQGSLRASLLATLSLVSSVRVPNIVIIDGLDECGDEATQLRVLNIIRDAVQQAPHFPLRFLICSRPEAWIREAFASEPFRGLSNVLRLDDEFRAEEDITKYCRHHFQKIVSNPKYKHVRFPDPWPSRGDFQTLVDRSCSQFVYVTTVFRFITLGDNHPVDKLHLVLYSSPNNQSATSPYPELDKLYYTILEADLDPEKACDILGAILILPGYLNPTPAHIELLLGLPSGQVALTLRGMHSVLRIDGREDEIRPYHTSFGDFLVDQNRSQGFYIDVAAQRHVIAHQWLQALTAAKMLAYSFDQLYDEETSSFFTEWRSFCTSLAKPTRSLLEHLQNVDLASVFLCLYVKEMQPIIQPFRVFAADPGFASDFLQWSKQFKSCHSWVENYCSGGEHHSDDLVKGLLVKLAKPPKCFHLIRAPGVGRRNDAISWAICLALGWRSRYTVYKKVASPHKVKQSGIRLTDCNCDRTKKEQSDDPGHLAYQEVCMELLTDFTSELDRSDHDSPYAFLHVVESSLLEHCRPNAELLSLCRTFLDSAQRCSQLRSKRTTGLRFCIHHLHPEHLISLDPQKTLLERIEAIKFPMNLAGEVEALKEQVLALPWDEWLASVNKHANSSNESSDGDEEESHNDNGRLNSNKERLDTDRGVGWQ
ncbi:hypothetical protein PM082_023274 [Marasmius tenuissimus]|nr:hypothetical protein PM082_023274 [Marasmius tenuissimus]